MKKYNKLLVLLGSFCAAALFGGLVLNKNIYFWYIWNVFLAIVPLILTFVFINLLKSKQNKYILAGIFFAWLFFLPNAFYVVTDFIHITDISFYYDLEYAQNNTNYILNIRPWFELLVTSIAFIISLVCGAFSVVKLSEVVKKWKNRLAQAGFIVIVSVLCAVGIYIGRFLRFNSWDILNPIHLLSEVLMSLNLFAIEFIAIFSLLVIFSIYAVKILYDLAKKPEA